MTSFWLGAGTGVAALALLQLVGALLYTWTSPYDARDVWESLAVVNGWWILAPLALLRDARRRRRHARLVRERAGLGRRTPGEGG